MPRAPGGSGRRLEQACEQQPAKHRDGETHDRTEQAPLLPPASAPSMRASSGFDQSVCPSDRVPTSALDLSLRVVRDKPGKIVVAPDVGLYPPSSGVRASSTARPWPRPLLPTTPEGQAPTPEPPPTSSPRTTRGTRSAVSLHATVEAGGIEPPWEKSEKLRSYSRLPHDPDFRPPAMLAQTCSFFLTDGRRFWNCSKPRDGTHRSPGLFASVRRNRSITLGQPSAGTQQRLELRERDVAITRRGRRPRAGGRDRRQR